jgi:hypothetical protein
MRPDTLIALSQAVLALHLGVIAYNIFGLVAIPLGAWRGWRFVRIRWWRLLHLISLLVVALQAMFGAACFLTLWQSSLREQAGEAASRAPLIQRTVENLVFLPLPFWSFTALYLAVFAYTLVLWRLVPPRRAADIKQGWTSGPTGPKV